MTCAGGVWGGCGAAAWRGWLSGSPGSWTAQRGALWRYDWPTGCAEAEKPATGKYRGRARKEGAFDATC